MKRIMICMLILIGLLGCKQNSNSNLSTFLFGNSNVNMAGIVVLDGNGSELGKALSVSGELITLYTSQGYIVYIQWDGKISPISNPIYLPKTYYTGTECTGTGYLGDLSSLGGSDYWPNYMGKTVFYQKIDNKLFKPKTINSDGTAYFNKSSTVATLSRKDALSSCSNNSNSIIGIELVETTRAEIGLPEVITLPITLEFK